MKRTLLPNHTQEFTNVVITLWEYFHWATPKQVKNYALASTIFALTELPRLEHIFMQREIAPTTGNPHWQVFLVFKKDTYRTVKQLQKLLRGFPIWWPDNSDHPTSKFKLVKGLRAELGINYCSKRNTRDPEQVPWHFNEEDRSWVPHTVGICAPPSRNGYHIAPPLIRELIALEILRIDEIKEYKKAAAEIPSILEASPEICKKINLTFKKI